MYTIVIKTSTYDDLQRILEIATRYNLEYSLAGNQLYLFINDSQTLIDVSIALKDDKP
jgi:hypothetical protein